MEIVDLITRIDFTVCVVSILSILFCYGTIAYYEENRKDMNPKAYYLLDIGGLCSLFAFILSIIVFLVTGVASVWL